MFERSQPDSERSGLYGIGMFWAYWRENSLPAEYRENPRLYNQRQMDLVLEAGGTNIPVNLGWINIEPVRGKVDWSLTDQQVEDAATRGLETIAYIGHTPDWAVPAQQGSPLPGWRTPPDEEFAELFATYCEKVAHRYRDVVFAYSFWNEPNGCSWINPGCANMNSYPLYTKWLKRAYPALKRGNPRCLVSAGSLDYHDGVPAGWKYVQGIYDHGGKAFFDAIDIHPYSSAGIHWRAILDTRQVMIDNDDGDKPIWISEYGWQRPDDEHCARELRKFLAVLKRPEFSFVTHARYLVVTDLNEGLYGLSDINLRPRALYWVLREAIQCPPADEIPPDLVPYEFLPSPGESPNDTSIDSTSNPFIEIEFTHLEYGQETMVRLHVPRTSEKMVDVRWYVNGQREHTATSLEWAFRRHPDQRSEFVIRGEAEYEKTLMFADATVTVEPFVSNDFTVVFESNPLIIERSGQCTLSPRVLNRSSHDLTWTWRVNGVNVETERSSELVVSSERFGPGDHTFEVECANAGMIAIAQVRVTIL